MSEDVVVKEEPQELEESCSPFDILINLADTTEQLIKYETDGLVKTEITVGEQNDEDCSLIKSDNVPSNVLCDIPSNVPCDVPSNLPCDILSNVPCDVPSNVPCDVPCDVPSNVPCDVPSNIPCDVPSNTSPSKDDSSPSSSTSHQLYKELLRLEPRRSKRSRKDTIAEDDNSGFKMKLPSKYKILFDAVLAFPEMSKDILPIIEELVHFHNCTCLLRTDMNLCRCGDCGKGFATQNGLKTHSRYCVLLKIEKGFGPANIEKHLGEAPEPFPPPVISEPTPEKVKKPRNRPRNRPLTPIKIEPMELEEEYQIPQQLQKHEYDEEYNPDQSDIEDDEVEDSEIEDDPDFLPLYKKPKIDRDPNLYVAKTPGCKQPAKKKEKATRSPKVKEGKAKDSVRPPMSAFIMWSTIQKAKILKDNPSMDHAVISEQLNSSWKELPPNERHHYFMESQHYKKRFGIKHKPGYQYRKEKQATPNPQVKEGHTKKATGSVLVPFLAKRITIREMQLEDKQFLKGTCWLSFIKTQCWRSPNTADPAACPKKLNPYDVFMNRGDVVYHNPIPMPIPIGLPSTAQNVYNTMISGSDGKLIPLEAGRKNYKQDVKKKKKEPPSLSSYPVSTVDELEPVASSAITSKSILKKKDKLSRRFQKHVSPKHKQKIKVSCPPRRDPKECLPNYYSTNILEHTTNSTDKVPSAFGMNSRRTKSIASPIKIANLNTVKLYNKDNLNQSTNIKTVSVKAPGNKFELLFKRTSNPSQKSSSIPSPITTSTPGPSTFGLGTSSTSEFDPPSPSTSYDQNSHTYTIFSHQRRNSQAHCDWLKSKITEYLAETNSTEKYGLEEHTLLFMRNFVAGNFPMFNTSVRKTAEKILKAFQDTIPQNDVKKKVLQECRAKVLPVVYLGERECIKKYGLEVETFNFLDSFAFGAANPSYKDINRAENILQYIEVRKLRDKLREEMSKNSIYFNSLPVKLRIVIGDFVDRVRPDKIPDKDFKMFAEILRKSASISEFTFSEGLVKQASNKLEEQKLYINIANRPNQHGSTLEENDLSPEYTFQRGLDSPSTRQILEFEKLKKQKKMANLPKPHISTLELEEDDLSSPETMRCAPKSPVESEIIEVLTSEAEDDYQVDYPENPIRLLNTLSLGLRTNDLSKESYMGWPWSTWLGTDFLRTFISSAITLPSFTSRLELKDRALLEMFAGSTADVSTETCDLIWGIYEKCGIGQDKWMTDTAKQPVTNDHANTKVNQETRDKGCQVEVDEEPEPCVPSNCMDHTSGHQCDLYHNGNNGLCSKKKQTLRIGGTSSSQPEARFLTSQRPQELTVCRMHMRKSVVEMPDHVFEKLVKSSRTYLKLYEIMDRELSKTRSAISEQSNTATAHKGTQFDSFHQRKRSYIHRYEEFNFEAQDKLGHLVKQCDALRWKVTDLEQQLETEKGIRQFFKGDTQAQAAGPASKKRTIQQLDAELKSARVEIRKLKLSQSCKAADNLKTENTKLKEQKQTLQQTIQTKCEEICSLEGSIQSVSEALRHQTKTISTLSRKHLKDNIIEEHNHRIYTGFESLVSVTCKILGNRLAQDNKKIEDPSEMRKLCQDLSGDENLFSIFMNVFCGNAVCSGIDEASAIEKRVLFLINLISYFYNGGIEDDENDEPSSSNLQELL